MNTVKYYIREVATRTANFQNDKRAVQYPGRLYKTDSSNNGLYVYFQESKEWQSSHYDDIEHVRRAFKAQQLNLREISETEAFLMVL